MNFQAYIDGKFISTTQQVDILNPLNQTVAGQVPALGKTEVDQAFKSAQIAFPNWKATPLVMRIKLIETFTNLLERNKQEIARIMHVEIAKPLVEGVIEVERTISYIHETIQSWNVIEKKILKFGKKTNHLHRVPLGVVLAISPFNYPVNLSLAKIIPALLTGNTVVFKPATNGSLTGAYLVTLFDQAQFPHGTINLVTGRGRDIGDSLTTNPCLSMISFTGGVTVGKEIASHTKMIPLVLELGGNDAAYVRKDANLAKAAKEIAKGAFGFSGQRCTAIKRLIVAQEVKEQFLALLIAETNQLTPVPLVTPAAADYVIELLQDDLNGGAKLLLGGKRNGHVIDLTIIDTHPQSRAWQEEAFGPLLPVVGVDSDYEALKIINDTNFGLQNSLFTTDLAWAQTFALEIESGTVNINASSSRSPDVFPFLGVKDSGFGVQGIEEALLSMTRPLGVIINE